jgi:hypothetical protein
MIHEDPLCIRMPHGGRSVPRSPFAFFRAEVFCIFFSVCVGCVQLASGSQWLQVDPGGSGAGHWESSARLQPSSASSPRSKRESSDGRGDGGLATSSCKSLKPAFWNYHEHPVSSFRHLYYSRCICICYIIYIYNILHIYIIYYIYM